MIHHLKMSTTAEIILSSRQRALHVIVQLAVISILTLITIAAFTHIATMLLFRRLVVGKRKSHIPAKSEGESNDPEEEFRIPVKAVLNHFVTIDESDADGEGISLMQRAANKLVKVWERMNDLPNTLREGLIRDSGITREVYMKRYNHRPQSDQSQILLLCNPSGETIETLSEKAVSLSKAIGFDSLVMFDYRPTGKSCRGLVAPDAKTMLEDAESVIDWLVTVNDIKISNISVCGISLGGLQAMRLAIAHDQIPRLVLINTFSSFSCLLRSSVSLLPGALRLGRTSSFLPDITENLHSLKTRSVAVVSVEQDERIPPHCTEELLTALRYGGSVRDILHIVMKGTHSNPKVDYNSLEMIREFLQLDE